jgi:PAS domain S-box-containing protein
MAAWDGAVDIRWSEDALRLLAAAGRVLGATLDLDATLRDFVGLVAAELDGGCLLVLLDAAGAPSLVVSAHPDPATAAQLAELTDRYPPDLDDLNSPLALTLRTGQPQLLAELDDDVLTAIARDQRHLELLRRLEPRSSLVVPIAAGVGTGTLGVLALTRTGPGRPLGQAELALARELAARAAAAVENARLFRSERAMRERAEAAEARFATAVETMLDCFGIFAAIRDERGRVRDFRVEHLNGAACTAHSLGQRGIGGRTLLDLMPGHRVSGLFDAYVHVVETGEPFAADQLVIEEHTAEGPTRRAFDVRATRHYDGVVAEWRDTTERWRQEERLAAQDRELRALLQNAPDVVARYDREGRCLFISDQVEREWGLVPAALTGVRVAELLMEPSLLERWRGALRHAFASGTPIDLEFTLTRLDATQHYQTRFAPEFDSVGDVRSVVTITRNVTRRVTVERALRERDAELALALDATGLGTWQYDVVADRARGDARCDAVFAGPGGRPHGDRASFLARVHAEDRERVESEIGVLMLPGGPAEFTSEFRVVWDDGSVHWISDRGRVERDAAGRAVRLHGVAFDVTASKVAESALRESEGRLQAIIDNCGSSISLKDPDGRYTMVNDAEAALAGCPREGLIGREMRDVLPADLAGECAAHEREALAAGTALRFEERTRVPDGAERRFLTVKFPLRDAGGAVYAVGSIATEITEHVRQGAELEIALERQRLAIEAAELGTWEMDLASGNLRFSPRMARMHGLPDDREHFTLDDCRRTTHPGDLERVEERYRASPDVGGEHEIEYRTVAPDGTVRWLAVRGSTVADVAGRPRVAVGVAVDVTARKSVELQLARAERRWRTLVQARNDAVWVIAPDVTDPAGLQWWSRLTGQAEEDLLRDSGLWLDALHPDDRERIRAEWETAEREGLVYDVTMRVRAAGGEWRIVRAYGLPIREGGVVREWVGTLSDETTLLEAQGALRLAGERERLAATAAGIGTWLWYVADQRLEWSEETYRLFGIPAGTPLTFENFIGAVHADDRRRVEAELARALAASDLTSEYRVVLADGTVRWLAATGTVERNVTGEPFRVLGVVQDVSDRRRVEERLRQSERLNAAGRLAGGVAHEVNNMMTAIIGFAEFVSSALGPGHPQAADMREILRAADRAAGVSRQLLAFTQQQVLNPTALDLNGVIEGTVPLLERVLGADRLLERRLTAVPEVVADRGQLEQVLVNLVLNARDATATGGRVTISTEAATLGEDAAMLHNEVEVRPGRYALLAVSDTGCGMAPETRARAFEPFFTTKPVGQGTGLGLSTVYGIVKQSGGYVWIYSEPGLGTTVKVYLPAAGPPGGRAAEPVAAGEGALVLVIEDEDLVRALAARALEVSGYRVISASSGADALGLLERHGGAVRAVLCDAVMPGMNGREFARRLAERWPGVPVLFMSGYPGNDVVQRGILDLDAPFLQKPFTTDRLVAALHALLEDARASGR